MKITNEVKLYIEDAVRGKAAAQRRAVDAKLALFKQKSAEYVQSNQTDYRLEFHKLREKAENQFAALMKKYNVAFSAGCNGSIDLPEVHVYNASFTRTSKFANEIAELKAQLVDLDEKIKKDINRIIAQLSLGGTFEDLEKLLAKVKYN